MVFHFLHFKTPKLSPLKKKKIQIQSLFEIIENQRPHSINVDAERLVRHWDL